MKKSVSLLILFVLSFLLAAGLGAQGQQMYRWTDDNGVVHFSDTPPPPGKNAEVSDLPKNDAPANPAERVAGGASSIAQQKRDEISDRKKEAKADALVMEAECEGQRSIVAQLEPHRRVYYKNEAGETVRMDDEERVKRVAESKKFIAEHCN